MKRAIGIDVGGTSIVGAVVGTDGTYTDTSRIPTPRTGAADVCAAVGQLARDLRLRDPDVADTVGVCLPGIIDQRTGTGITSANLGWANSPLRDLLEAASGHPVLIAQDVRSGAMAEARWGIGLDSFYYLALGTGLGAATILDGRPHSINPLAGEIGQYLVPDPDTGDLVRLEELVSATGLIARARRFGLIGPEAGAREVIELGTATSRRLVEDSMRILGQALAPALFMLGPLPVVLGGGPSGGGSLLTEPLADELAHQLRPLGAQVPVLTAKLGDKSQMIGAAALVFTEK